MITLNNDTVVIVVLQVVLVTGGTTGLYYDYLDSTEIMVNFASWTIAGAKLAWGMAGLQAATLDQKVYVFGGK